MCRTILEMGADVAYIERRMREEFVGAEVCGTSMRIATLRRDGPRAPIVFLHGFGSSKEDFADIVRFQQFDNHGVLAFDAPGCGVSECSNLAAVTVEFLQQGLPFQLLLYSTGEKAFFAGISLLTHCYKSARIDAFRVMTRSLDRIEPFAI